MTDVKVTRADREAALLARFPYLKREQWSERTIAFVERGEDDEGGNFAPEVRGALAIATARAEGYAAAVAEVLTPEVRAAMDGATPGPWREDVHRDDESAPPGRAPDRRRGQRAAPRGAGGIEMSALTVKWACPKCGAGVGEHGRGVATCYHCGWSGVFPKKPRGLQAWEKKALDAGSARGAREGSGARGAGGGVMSVHPDCDMDIACEECGAAAHVECQPWCSIVGGDGLEAWKAAQWDAAQAQLRAADALAGAVRTLLVTNGHGVDEHGDECPEGENGPDIGCTCVEGKLGAALAAYDAVRRAR